MNFPIKNQALKWDDRRRQHDGGHRSGDAVVLQGKIGIAGAMPSISNASISRRLIARLLVVLFCFGGVILSTMEARAQDEEERRRGAQQTHWTAELPGGKFIVPHHAITSISMHEYVVDGAARVVEVSVGTIGSVQGRFYFIEPYTPEIPIGAGQEALEKIKEQMRDLAAQVAPDEVWSKVVKNYPTTTHAHTVEFRLESRDALQRLFNHLERSYVNRRTATYRP